MSTTAPKPATTPIPVQLSEPEFEAFILPHLSMPKRGPKCKLGYHCLFNLILWVLYTGMQWNEFIPIKPSAATESAVPGSCAGHSRVPSPDRGYHPSTSGSGLSRSDNASRYC